jgi:NADH-quinone oxidoreductase subunit M
VTLASVALPGMNGFVGEFLILLGAFGSTAIGGAKVFTAVAATGVILSAVYMLWMFQRVNYGPMTNDKNRGLRDLSVREWIVIAPICAMCIVMGVAPNWFLKPMEPSVRKVIEEVVGVNRTQNTLAETPAGTLGPGPTEAVVAVSGAKVGR